MLLLFILPLPAIQKIRHQKQMKKSLLFLTAFITFNLQFLTLNTTAQPQLWGMTNGGGQDNIGVIFKADSAANSETVQQAFSISYQGANPKYANLVKALDGKLYGMTYAGGSSNAGVLFQFDPAANTYSKKVDFTGTATGGQPMGSLMLASDGKLYGMTYSGGTNGAGVIFNYDPAANIFTKKIDLSNANGSYPNGSLLKASDGMFYGMTNLGGANSTGVIFQYDPIGNTYTKKVDLITANGSLPVGSLIQATDGMLYGMTQHGGANSYGVLFKYNPVTSTYTKKIDFDANGGNPFGSLMQASDGMLYGMNWTGGANAVGLIFQYDPVGNTYTKKIDFNGTNGSNPYGSLIQAFDGMLYGMTYQGGANNLGVLFQYDPVANICANKIDFNGTEKGSNPYSSLMQAADGKLYGMTNIGGGLNLGALFQYDPAANTFSKKIDFNGAANGSNPAGALMQASDGMLYGMTAGGGATGFGVLFQYNPVSTIYTKKIDFSAAIGSSPMGSLMQASDGMLYGMTYQGGANNDGVIFQYNPAANTYSKKLDFDVNNGQNPYGSLLQASDGTLYGMTSSGGANGNGVLFQYNPITNTYSDKFDFDGTNGDSPQGSLMQASDGMLYGMTQQGGSGRGVLFQYNPASNIFTKKLSFSATRGQYPAGSLMQASDGMLYGITISGGSTGKGVLFQYDPAANIYTKKVEFNGTNGYQPYGTLTQASDGMLYGTTFQGGANAIGVIFQYSIAANTLSKKLDFNGTNGKYPQYSNLIDITISITTAAVKTNNCAGSSISVPYVNTGLYNSGNVFTAQLSDASGSFATPINIGTLASYTAAGTISALIPLNTTLGTGYRIRVVSSSPAITGKDNGSNISINPYLAVTASVSPSPNVCAGSSVTLTGGGAVSYSWTGGITDAASFSPSSTATYTVTGTDGNGCTNTAVKTITVNTLPTVFAYATATTVCTGTSVTLAGLGNAVSYTWTGGITDGIAFVQTAASNTYTVTGTDGNGCTGTASKTITVNPVPTVTASASINTVCAGTSVTLTAGGTALNYSWSGGVTDGIGFVPSSTNTYTVTGTDANGCSETAAKTITVNPLPIVFAYATGTTVCAGTSVTLSGLGNASSYTWTGGVIDGDAFTPTAASTSYTVTGTDGNNCSSTASKTITVLPIASGTQSPSVCAGHSITVGNHTYTASGTYTDVLTSFNGCDSTVTTHLTVNNVSVSVSGAVLTANEAGASYQWLNCSNGYAVIAGQTNQSFTTATGGSYAVIITRSSCSDTSACYVTTTGIDENVLSNSVTIYPNPFTEQTTISFDNEQRNTAIKITDILGKEVKTAIMSGTKNLILEKGEMKAGIYFVQIITEKGTAVKKIIVN